jgi:hypothetical protein
MSGPLVGKTWCEYLADQIPEGDKCDGCAYWARRGAVCLLFSEPCTGGKNVYCRNNKWLDGIRTERRMEQ